MVTDDDKYAFLNRFSTSQLKELLRADVESLTNNNVDLILHILEVIEQREKGNAAENIPEVAEALAEFQEYYNIPEGEGQTLFPCTLDDEKAPRDESHNYAKGFSNAKAIRSHRVVRYGLVAVIAVAILLGGMVSVQAAGIDVFGALGRWTAETFHFETGSLDTDTSMNSDKAEDEYVSQMRSALESHGISTEYAPTWYPDGFESISTDFLSDDLGDTLYFSFKNEEDHFFNIKITHYFSESYVEKHIFEKDDAPVEKYVSGEKLFYIFSNINTVTATWSDGVFLETISGDLSIEEVKTIIDSIGER